MITFSDWGGIKKNYLTTDDQPEEFKVPYLITVSFCIASFVLGINALIWGCILARGETTIQINNVPTIVDESKFLGPGLLYLAGYFMICMIMFLTFYFSMGRKYDCNRPWFYCFSVAVFPAIFASYYFIQRIGMNTQMDAIFCGLIGLGCSLLCASVLGYIYYITNLKLSPKPEPAKRSIV